MLVEKNNKKSVKAITKPAVTDAIHLIDLPVQEKFFSRKTQGDAVKHPKATIKILTFPYPKNGLANLL
ncbi:hypothetical protein EV200_11157 [Pedobacter psychrotolerans]|uniref:Uncharacterized protein n=1 Tax=Pedobacter psychrotolerans TaxID=1843235 RepID=A0A4R2H1Z0_9SPHI|nr:hypothetical protein [Pedobacter psychrotolerans]TCO18719.1 hypothetical protein EV200_11157 [Pedobacter psychrotolerans]GGE70254.1 hypothetical protein GCM10011413_41160 [Pedobacter psychrotolerans]